MKNNEVLSLLKNNRKNYLFKEKKFQKDNIAIDTTTNNSLEYVFNKVTVRKLQEIKNNNITLCASEKNLDLRAYVNEKFKTKNNTTNSRGSVKSLNQLSSNYRSVQNLTKIEKNSNKIESNRNSQDNHKYSVIHKQHFKDLLNKRKSSDNIELTELTNKIEQLNVEREKLNFWVESQMDEVQNSKKDITDKNDHIEDLKLQNKKLLQEKQSIMDDLQNMTEKTEMKSDYISRLEYDIKNLVTQRDEILADYKNAMYLVGQCQNDSNQPTLQQNIEYRQEPSMSFEIQPGVILQQKESEKNIMTQQDTIQEIVDDDSESRQKNDYRNSISFGSPTVNNNDMSLQMGTNTSSMKSTRQLGTNTSSMKSTKRLDELKQNLDEFYLFDNRPSKDNIDITETKKNASMPSKHAERPTKLKLKQSNTESDEIHKNSLNAHDSQKINEKSDNRESPEGIIRTKPQDIYERARLRVKQKGKDANVNPEQGNFITNVTKKFFIDKERPSVESRKSGNTKRIKIDEKIDLITKNFLLRKYSNESEKRLSMTPTKVPTLPVQSRSSSTVKDSNEQSRERMRKSNKQSLNNRLSPYRQNDLKIYVGLEENSKHELTENDTGNKHKNYDDEKKSANSTEYKLVINKEKNSGDSPNSSRKSSKKKVYTPKRSNRKYVEIHKKDQNLQIDTEKRCENDAYEIKRKTPQTTKFEDSKGLSYHTVEFDYSLLKKSVSHEPNSPVWKQLCLISCADKEDRKNQPKLAQNKEVKDAQRNAEIKNANIFLENGMVTYPVTYQPKKNTLRRYNDNTEQGRYFDNDFQENIEFINLKKKPHKQQNSKKQISKKNLNTHQLGHNI